MTEDTRVETFRRMMGLLPVKTILQVSYGEKYNLDIIARVKHYEKLMSCSLTESPKGLSYRNESFDLVLAYNTLSHLAPENLQLAVDEIARVANLFVLIIDQWSFSEEKVGDIWLRDYGTVFWHLKAIDWGNLTKEDGFKEEPNWWLFEKVILPFKLEFV